MSLCIKVAETLKKNLGHPINTFGRVRSICTNDLILCFRVSDDLSRARKDQSRSAAFC